MNEQEKRIKELEEEVEEILEIMNHWRKRALKSEGKLLDIRKANGEKISYKLNSFTSEGLKGGSDAVYDHWKKYDQN